MSLVHPGDEHALNVIKFKGIGFALPEKMAFDLMDDFGLFLKRQRNDLVGEKSALFKHDGKIYRIQAVSMGAATKYKLYLKDWMQEERWMDWGINLKASKVL